MHTYISVFILCIMRNACCLTNIEIFFKLFSFMFNVLPYGDSFQKPKTKFGVRLYVGTYFFLKFLKNEEHML